MLKGRAAKATSLKACAFDLGNTLTDDVTAFEAAVAETDAWLHDRGLIDAPGSFASTYTEVNRGSREPFVSHTYGELPYFTRTFAALGISLLSPEEGLAAYRRFVTARFTLAAEVHGALSWLREQGFKSALVSNESVARVTAFMEKTDGDALFDEIIVSEAVGYEKPDPAIFREALRRLGVEGPELVMLGDNEVADGACRALGIRFVLVTGLRRAGWRWERGIAHEPDYVIERVDLPSLKRALAALGEGR